MKILLCVPLFLLGSIQHIAAQKTPPQAVMTAFAQKFAEAKDVDWKREKNGDWEAETEQGETEMTAVFSASGQWLETETGIAKNELPAPVLAVLQGKKIKEAARILKADGSTVYEAEVKGQGDLIFDARGNLLKKE